MPLTPAKAKHITSLLPRIFQGRTGLINLTCKNADGSTHIVAINAILKPVTDADPTLNAVVENDPTRDTDAIMMCLSSDVDLPTLRSCIYLEKAVHSGIEPAGRYLIDNITAKGILPGADRFVVSLTRQR